MPELARLLARTQPDDIPDLTVDIEVTLPPQFQPNAEPTCTCRALDAIGSNPTCDAHPWWLRDTPVLDLADHPDGPWAAALKVFGGGA